MAGKVVCYIGFFYVIIVWKKLFKGSKKNLENS